MPIFYLGFMGLVNWHHGVVISWVRIDYANPLPRIHGFGKLASWSCYLVGEDRLCQSFT